MYYEYFSLSMACYFTLFNTGIQRAENFNFDGIHFIIFLNAFNFLCLSRECLVSLRLQVFYPKFPCRGFIVLLFTSVSIFYFDLILCMLWGKGKRFLCVLPCSVLFSGGAFSSLPLYTFLLLLLLLWCVDAQLFQYYLWQWYPLLIGLSCGLS